VLKDDKFFWFKENRIVIPGVKREHVFMHLTDSHIDVVDELSTEEEIEKYNYQHELWAKYKKVFADKFNEPYGEPQMITMLEAFEKMLALAEEMQPEALLMSGDNLDNMHPAGERYLVKRMAEYPPIGEQLDMIYWDKINGTDLWTEKITEIKNKYPKA